MKILASGKKNGRTFICGRGTYEEVKSLNIEKDFNAALDILFHIRKMHNYAFGGNAGYKVERNIYGKRKAV
ncbi:MAG: hypothetical protein ABSH12_07295 [Endomicrobiales bacterium]|jgi:hypothetical protein